MIMLISFNIESSCFFLVASIGLIFLGVLLNVNIWTPTSVEAEIPLSSSLLSLLLEYKKTLKAEPAKEMDLMELTADEGMDRESQACMEQELGNEAYTRNDFDAAIAHYTKVMELDNGNISCLMNRAVAYLAMGQVWQIWLQNFLDQTGLLLILIVICCLFCYN